jgi:hypothetical protein
MTRQDFVFGKNALSFVAVREILDTLSLTAKAPRRLYNIRRFFDLPQGSILK